MNTPHHRYMKCVETCSYADLHCFYDRRTYLDIPLLISETSQLPSKSVLQIPDTSPKVTASMDFTDFKRERQK